MADALAKAWFATAFFVAFWVITGEKWTGSPSQEDFVKRFSSKPALAIAKKLGDYLEQNSESRHGALALACCERVEKCYTELDNIVKGMEPKLSKTIIYDRFILDMANRDALMSWKDSEYIIRGASAIFQQEDRGMFGHERGFWRKRTGYRFRSRADSVEVEYAWHEYPLHRSVF